MAFALAGCMQNAEAGSGYTDISNSELKDLLNKGVTLIDIRRPEEWKQTGVIKGSHKITLFNRSGRIQPDFQQKFEAVTDPEKPVILICRTGNRTAVASKLITEQLGYKKIYNVKRGITDWIRHNNPVVRN
jgi:rhodanese-related sulfurtransferase